MSGVIVSVRQNLAGAWAVMNGRGEGLGLVDVSVSGFWKSFAAIGLIVPFAMLALLGERSMMAAAGEAVAPVSGGYLAGRLAALLADWLVFPVVFAILARPLGLGGSYVAFIVVRNWGSVITMLFAGAAHGLLIVGAVPPAAAPFLLLVVLALALRFAFSVARIALGVPVGMAIPIVILDVVLSLVLEAVFSPG